MAKNVLTALELEQMIKNNSVEIHELRVSLKEIQRILREKEDRKEEIGNGSKTK